MNRIQNPQEAADLFLSALRQSRCAVGLTGAGVSTASGIPDFRGAGGLYSKISPRTFEIDFFLSNPGDYYKIALEHIHPLADKTPNPTHTMLARLEQENLLKALITQNIDGLHSKAGSKNVIEFHGNVVDFYCLECESPSSRSQVDSQIRSAGVPKCPRCGGLIRPGIVFFGDLIPFDALQKAREYSRQADVFVVLGSSLEVNPAASLALDAQRAGAKLVIINRGPTRLDPIADERYELDLTEFSNTVLSLLETKEKDRLIKDGL
ncbi:MAG TPA: NAD-dependent protein deacylase [Anaerohalosphaeraceae bacterium]|nr:NAD-dependent protein deacylase [Anaerohalosphaeraceae bacterium]HOL88712.1 NAD-dependent protein deacylase [Anaerohalosphaeraceae bacterium]HPP56554.1 NAD-dependent protein deacylase [Anaerohalosphaeraceae bacterium]